MFKGVNNEHELIKLNSDVYNENLKFKFTNNLLHFENKYFSSSDLFL